MRLNVSRRARFAALGFIAAALAVYLFFPAVRAAVDGAAAILLTADTGRAVQDFRGYLLGFGAWAPLASAALMVLQSVVAPLPAFVLTFANGLLFGWGWGALLSWSSAMAGAALCFWIARALGRPVVEKLVGGSRALEASDVFFARWGQRAVLVARLLPFVSFDVISYGAGLTTMRLAPFLVATGLGQLPATLLYSYLGENATGSVRALFWVFTITVALGIVGWVAGPKLMQRLEQRRRPARLP